MQSGFASFSHCSCWATCLFITARSSAGCPCTPTSSSAWQRSAYSTLDTILRHSFGSPDVNSARRTISFSHFSSAVSLVMGIHERGGAPCFASSCLVPSELVQSSVQCQTDCPAHRTPSLSCRLAMVKPIGRLIGGRQER